MTSLSDKEWGYLTLRMTLGINMLMHGLTRIIAGTGGFVSKVSTEFEDGILPMFLVRAFLLVLPFVEFAVGALMILGWQMRIALIFGGLIITALTFGSTAKQDWSAAGVQLVYAMAFSLLLAARNYNRLCFDRLDKAPQ